MCFGLLNHCSHVTISPNLGRIFNPNTFDESGRTGIRFGNLVLKLPCLPLFTTEAATVITETDLLVEYGCSEIVKVPSLTRATE